MFDYGAPDGRDLITVSNSSYTTQNRNKKPKVIWSCDCHLPPPLNYLGFSGTTEPPFSWPEKQCGGAAHRTRCGTHPYFVGGVRTRRCEVGRLGTVSNERGEWGEAREGERGNYNKSRARAVKNIILLSIVKRRLTQATNCHRERGPLFRTHVRTLRSRTT